MIDPKLEGKVALITGANHGIGAAAARAFAAQGAKVFVTYYREPCRFTEEELAKAREAGISYAASKHAIESYSRSAAAEIGQYGVTVNEDVADVIVFLASEQAHWLTGQLLYVGGGWRMHQ